MDERGRPVYVCMACGAHTTVKLVVQGIRMPFCNFRCAGSWRKAERAERREPRRRPVRKRVLPEVPAEGEGAGTQTAAEEVKP